MSVNFNDITSLPGFWDPKTSWANFCEIDYQISFYIAEFINTLTNLAYIYYAFYGPAILSSRARATELSTLNQQGKLRLRHDLVFRLPGLKLSLDLHSLNLIAVGLGSGAYHMSLRVWPNIADELSMYHLAAGFIYDLFTFNLSHDSPIRTIWSSVLFAGLSANLIAVVIYESLALHSITFALMLILTGARILWLIPKVKPGTKSSSITKRTLYYSFFKSWLLINVAFGLWIVDVKYCSQLRHIREQIGLHWSFLLELHGYWHILTAVAAAEWIALIRTLSLVVVFEHKPALETVKEE